MKENNINNDNKINTIFGIINKLSNEKLTNMYLFINGINRQTKPSANPQPIIN